MAPPNRPATIQDVATRANVSTKTVSRVINKESGVNILTREKVEAVIKAMDYRPNMAAQALAGDRSFLIGLFTERPGSYVSELQAGVIQRCRENGFHLIMEPWEAEDPTLEDKVATMLRTLRMEAVILPPPFCDHEVMLALLDREAVPYIRIAPKHNRHDSPIIRTHDYVAARLMTAHLLNFGHRKIGMLLGVAGHTATEQRFQGFTDELTQQGLQVDPSLVLPGEFSFDAGEIAAEKMLTGPNPPTAIFACNDDMALAVLAVAQRLGIRVPQDLSVTGFDDTPMSHMTWPQITTVRQPVREIGRVAADLIISHAPRRNGWPDPMPNRLMNLELVIRTSSGPVAQKKS